MWGHRVDWLPHEYDGSGVGHLHYPNDIDRSLNESVTDKIRKYHTDYNNNPPNSISFMPVIASTSGRLHSKFVHLLFLQTHRETDRFFATSGVQFAEHDRGQFWCPDHTTITHHTLKPLVY